MEIPLKLLALVTGGRSVRFELSESVLLHGRGSRLFISLSVLLCRLLDGRLELSLFPLQNRSAEQVEQREQVGKRKKEPKTKRYKMKETGQPVIKILIVT